MTTAISTHHLNLLLALRRDELKKTEKALAQTQTEKWFRIRTERADRIRVRIAKLETQIREAKGAT